ncbi:DUF975 family protein [Patescibacteria group bacterium]|nr:DUF975 family protein [Patescibacteria group bacterium]
MTKNKPQFSKKEAIKQGYETVRKNLLLILKIMVVLAFVYTIPNALQKSVADNGNLFIVIGILIWILNIMVNMGLVKISIKFAQKEKVSLRDLFYTKSILTYVVASFLTGIIVFLGFILLIIPGIYLAIRLQFSTYLIVDKKMGIMDSIKTSWRITKGHTWNLFLFGLLLLLLNILGAIALVVGLIITIPTTGIATASVYKKLSQ